jgi:hypothetical protein
VRKKRTGVLEIPMIIADAMKLKGLKWGPKISFEQGLAPTIGMKKEQFIHTMYEYRPLDRDGRVFFVGLPFIMHIRPAGAIRKIKLVFSGFRVFLF